LLGGVAIFGSIPIFRKGLLPLIEAVFHPHAQERIEITFDADRGFPTTVSFQPHEADDQSEYFEIRNFKAQSPAPSNKSQDRAPAQ
jgi:hypothetical protein